MKVHEANSDGSKGLIIPKHTTGPEGEPIEPGDTVTVKIVNVEKQATGE